jgi:retron-type reverse transcriptase
MSLECFRINRHRGRTSEFHERYNVLAYAACNSSAGAYRRFSSQLPRWISDERNLKIAADYLASHGGRALGRDGISVDDFPSLERWELSRTLGDELRSQAYRHGPWRTVKVPKYPVSRGMRSISIANFRDRVVARATAQILRPVLEAQASFWSFCRFDRGRTIALAAARHLIVDRGCSILIRQDLQKAFDRVPRQRLLQIVRKMVPSDDVRDLVANLTSSRTKRGIPQGSAVSPLIMNAYLGHSIDGPWASQCPGPVLVRYMDDMLVFCDTSHCVTARFDDLSRLIRDAGMRPKYGLADAVVDIRTAPVDWLGYQLQLDNGTLRVLPARLMATGESACGEWLAEKFLRLHELSDGWKFVPNVVRGVIAGAAPTFPFVDVELVYRNLVNAAREAALEWLMPSSGQVELWFAEAYEKSQRAAARFAKYELAPMIGP